MLREALLPLTPSHPSGIWGRKACIWKFCLEICCPLNLINGWRLQVGDLACASTSKLFFFFSGGRHLLPQGTDHNITSASKLFIWGSWGNKKLLESYRLCPDSPSSIVSIPVQHCVKCAYVCLQACLCILVCSSSYGNMWLTCLVWEIHVFDTPQLLCGNWNVLFESKGNYFEVWNGRSLWPVFVCVRVCAYTYLYLFFSCQMAAFMRRPPLQSEWMVSSFLPLSLEPSSALWWI